MPIDFSKVDLSKFNTEGAVEPEVNPAPNVLEGAKINPAQHAKNMELSEKSGVPIEAVADDPASVEANTKFSGVDLSLLPTQSPNTAKFLEGSFNGAVVAQNDLNNGVLQKLETLLTMGVDTAARAPLSGAITTAGATLTGAAETVDATGRLAGSELNLLDLMYLPSNVIATLAGRDAADPVEQLQDAGGALKDAGEFVGVPKDRQNLATDISGAIGQMGAQIASVILAPSVGAPSLFAQGVDQQADRQRKSGTLGKDDKSDAGLLLAGGASLVTEKLGIDAVLERIPPNIRNNMLRKVTDVIMAGGIEAGQEVLEGVAHDLIELYTSNPDAEMFQGVEHEAMVGGGAGAVVRAFVNWLVPSRIRYTGDDAANKQAAEDAQQMMLEQLNVLATSSEMRQLSPESFKQFMKKVDGDKDTVVYIDALQAHLYLQERTEAEVVADKGLTALDAALVEANETGTDVVLPIEVFTAEIAGGQVFTDLQEHMTLDASLETAFRRGEAEQELTAFTQRIVDEADKDSQEYAEADRIYKETQAALADTGVYSPEVSKAMATVMPAWIAAKAKRTGRTVAEVAAASQLTIEGPQTGKMADLKNQLENPNVNEGEEQTGSSQPNGGVQQDDQGREGEGTQATGGVQGQESQEVESVTGVQLNTSTGADFHAKLSEAKAAHPDGASVSVSEVAEYDEMQTFTMDDGKIGFAVNKDGYLTGVFKHPDSSVKGAMSMIIEEAINQGATNLDAFEGHLTEGYAKGGFVETSRMKWDDQYAPEGWDYEKNGRPDVVTMELNNEGLQRQARQNASQESRELGDSDGGVGGERLNQSGGATPLAGAPKVKDATGPIPELVAVAEAYAASIGLPFTRQAYYTKADPERGARIAKAYEEMKHDPSDPVVAEAYANLIAQTTAQYHALVDAGYVFKSYDGDTDPYETKPWNAMRDLRHNKVMAVYTSDEGFGSGDTDLDVSANPLLAKTGIFWEAIGKDEPVEILANDLFRAVHDAFGHGLEGAGFRADGEENAWQAHVRLFHGSAVGAITSETRGQNSWLNFGPHGDTNRTAGLFDTIFADQKTGLMPEWTWTEGRVEDEVVFEQAARKKKDNPVPVEIDALSGIDEVNEFARSKPFKTNRDFKIEIQDRVIAAAKAAKVDLTKDTPAVREYLKRVVKSDAIVALRDNPNAVGWYNEKVKKALKILSIRNPEINTDPDAKFAFTWVLAVTSNGLKVDKNFELAEKAYTHFKQHGEMPIDIGIGTASDAINAGMGVYNKLSKEMGLSEFTTAMTTKSTVKEIKALTGEKIGGESASAEVYGAAIIGPKIGNGFFANLYGNYEQLTVDRWFMRGWGRWIGKLVSVDAIKVKTKKQKLNDLIALLSPADKKALKGILDVSLAKTKVADIAKAVNKKSTKKDTRLEISSLGVVDDFTDINAIMGEPKANSTRVSIGDEIRKLGNGLAMDMDGQIEAPKGVKQLVMIREVMNEVLLDMKADNPDLTMADLQALLWYPEKRLYDSAKVAEKESDKNYEDDEAPDYANAAVALARSHGVDESKIQEALKEVDDDIAREQAAAARQRAGRQANSGDGEKLHQEARGYYAPAQNLIRLNQSADLSTFLHEFAHFAYEQELREPSGMRDDIHAWFKRNAEDVAAEANGYLNAKPNGDFNQTVDVEQLTSTLQALDGVKTVLLSESGDTVELSSLIIDKDKRKAGVGTEVMTKLTSWADVSGKRLTLSPAVRDDFQGTTSRARLVKFYKRFGFVENKGRNKDFEISDGMYRNPAQELNQELPMDDKSRLARGEAMGFHTSQVWYHGSPARFSSFNRGEPNYYTDDTGFIWHKDDVGRARPEGLLRPKDQDGYFFTNDRDEYAGSAVDYAGDDGVVYETYLRLGKPYTLSDYMVDSGMTEDDLSYDGDMQSMISVFDGDTDAIIEFAKKANADSILFEYEGDKLAIVFKPEDIRDINAAFDTRKAGSPELLAQSAIDQTETAEFKNWSGGGEVVESHDVNDHQFEKGKPTVLKVMHGTTHDFDEFDATLANQDGYFGAMSYFTTSEEDAERNYGGIGPDLANRISDRAYKVKYDIESMIEDVRNNFSAEYIEEADNDELIDEMLQDLAVAVNDQFGTDIQHLDIPHDEGQIDSDALANRIANEELYGGDDKVLELYVKVENPFIVGAGSNFVELLDWDDIDSKARQNVADENDITVDELTEREDEFEDELSDERNRLMEESDNPLIEAVTEIVGEGGYPMDLIQQIRELDDGASADLIHQILRASDEVAYAEGSAGQVINEIIEHMGFDSIILRDANWVFNGMGMDSGTAHVHLFDKSKKNIKSVDNAGTFDPDDANIYKQDGVTPEDAFGEIQPEMVAKYLDEGTTGNLAYDAAIRRATHEQFARGFEAYLMEGKAPSPEMRTVFQKFARWLTDIYKSMKGLNVNLDDEAREVFDRLIATDEQIDQARARGRIEPMFTDAAMAGMTEEQYAKYLEKQEASKDKQTETLRDKMIKAITNRTKKWWKEEKADIIAEEMDKLKSEKVHAARTALIDGTFKLDTATVKERVGETKTNKLGHTAVHVPSKLRHMTAKGKKGVHPDEAAAFLGYNSGAELLSDLISAPTIRQAADERAEAIMVERYGDVLNDGSIEREADDAVQDESRGKLILAELKQLTKGTNVRAIELKAVKDVARQKIAQLNFRQIKPETYRRAEIRMAQQAAKLLAEGDKEGAALAKKTQVMNHWLAIEAAKAKADITKTVDFMARYRKSKVKQKIQMAGAEYWEQLDKILSRFQFKKTASLASVAKTNQGIEAWMNDQIENHGAGLVLTNTVLDESIVTHWKEISYSELQGIKDSVKNIEHVATYANKLKTMGEEIRYEKHVADLIGAAEETGTGDDFKVTVSKADDPSWARDNAQWAMAQMTKIPFLASWMEGGSRTGVWASTLVKPFTEALDNKFKLYKEVGEPVMGMIKNRDRKTVKRHNTKVFIPEIVGTGDGAHTGNMMGHEILAVALNVGNEGNLRKLLLGEGWADVNDESSISIDNPKLQAVLAHMTESDWQMVQKIWDQIDILYPKLEAVHRETTGLSPAKVVATPVETPFGTFSGGYYPVKYDPRRSRQAADHAARADAETESMFNMASIQASVNASATNERTGYYAPMMLSMDVVPNHIDETIHYITHHAAIRETNKLLRDPRVKAAVTQKLGPHEYNQLLPWLNDVAKDGRVAPNRSYINSAWNQLRLGTTLGVMGFKASTGIIQISGLSNSAAETGMIPTLKAVGMVVGRSRLINSMRRILGSDKQMESAWEFAAEHSKVMGHRATTMDREILNAMNTLSGRRGKIAVVQEASMKHIALIQTYMVDLPTWHAAYAKELGESGDHDKAVQAADWVVENVQGSGATKDMASLMRSQTKTHTIFTMFMTYFSALWNLQRDAKRGHKEGTYSTSGIAAKAMFLYAVPVLFEMVMRGEIGDEDDEPEEQLAEYMVNLALFPVQSVPFVRDIVNGVTSGYGYNASPVTSQVEKGLQGLGGIAKALFTDKEMTQSQVKNATKLIGASIGVPATGQAWATAEHIQEVLEEGEDFSAHSFLFGPERD